MRPSDGACRENWLWRWLKFNLVGAIGTLVQLAVLSFLTGVLGMNYLLATALAVEAAILHNFVWHDRFTWVDRSGLALRRLARFLRFNLTSGAISVAGNLVSVSLLVEQAHLSVLNANLLAVAFCSPSSYIATDRIVFRARVRSQIVHGRLGPERHGLQARRRGSFLEGRKPGIT